MLRALVKRLVVLVALVAPLSGSAQISIPVYGNWCGPDYPLNPAMASAPVDALDAACMRHDYCIAVQGRFDCGCDLSFMTELRTTQWQNPAIQSDARGIHDAIAIVPCNDPFGNAQKQGLFMGDLLIDSLNGNAAPMDIMQRWQRLLENSLR